MNAIMMFMMNDGDVDDGCDADDAHQVVDAERL